MLSCWDNTAPSHFSEASVSRITPCLLVLSCWGNAAPSPFSEASVSKINSLLKSGYPNWCYLVWDNTTPSPFSEASVSKINYLLKSGYLVLWLQPFIVHQKPLDVLMSRQMLVWSI